MDVKRGQFGFSLIELMVSIVLIGVLLGAIFTLFVRSQQSFPSEQELSEATQNARYAMELMAMVIRQAGNDLQRKSNDPCQANNHPCINGDPISGTATTLHVLADITGSVGSRGDPDCTTKDPFEDVTFSYDSTARNIQMQLGSGSPEPIARNIAGLNFQYFTYDGTGNLVATTVPCQIRVVQVTITATSEHSDAQTLGKVVPKYSFSSHVEIRNRK